MEVGAKRSRSLGEWNEEDNNVIALPLPPPPSPRKCYFSDQAYFNYSRRAFWLRAMVLGCNEGVVSTILLLLGIETFSPSTETKYAIVACLAGLVMEALRLAVSEFVSVCTQVDIQTYQIKRDVSVGRRAQNDQLPLMPSPAQVATVVALSYVAGGAVPLVAAGMIGNGKVQSAVAVVTACGWMVAVAVAAAAPGRAPLVRSIGRVVLGGWLMIAVTFGKIKLLRAFSSSTA